MFSRKVLSQIPCLLMTLAAIAATPVNTTGPANMLTARSTTKPNCPRKCGNLTVPYPFGIETTAAGGRRDCSMDSTYRINCNYSFHPPKAFLYCFDNIEVINISESHLRIRDETQQSCYNVSNSTGSIYHGIYPYTYSSTRNSFTLIGCNVFVVIYPFIPNPTSANPPITCYSACMGDDYSDVTTGSCSGFGCCQTNNIPKGLYSFFPSYFGTNFTSLVSKESCTYAFIGETNSFTFEGKAHLLDPNFPDKIANVVPIVLDWDVGGGTKCPEARKNPATYVCQGNTRCINSLNSTASGGYRCSCLPGYEGNPYLTPGCTDINECAAAGSHNCSSFCTNIEGSYKCSCPKRHHGDGFTNGTGCVPPNYSQLVLKVGLGSSSALLFIFLSITLFCVTMRSQRMKRMKEKFFEENGGLLLMQQLASNQSGMQSTKIFTTKELKLATSNYSENRIIGTGGYGTVYKGILPNNHVVAVKKSKIVDQSQIEQFINEMVILTGINHRHVVKLLGCCLEEEVPLLVYEFISNGTLFELIHQKTSWLTWTASIRIATEAANALSYLHSAASIPIIHRDVKTTNILIDDTYAAKISDFGASRLVPLDQTRVTTLVLGTLGYLDPEYFQTSQLTEKSDVYSFGVVLAELLTREKPLCIKRRTEDRNLASHLVSAMKEDRLLEIIHPQLIKEAHEEQLASLAKLGQTCLSMKGEDRPTMKEVAMKLEELNKSIKHPWDDEPNYDEEGNNFITGYPSSSDLYPPPHSSDVNIINEQVSSSMVFSL